LQTRAFSHIADVAPAIARSPLVDAARNEVFNVGADQPYTILELANAIAQAFGVEPAVLHLEARNEVVDAFSDHSKARRVFGAADPITLKDGIERMAAWVREQGPREQIDFVGEIEVDINLPPSWRKRQAR
ncbi:MAG: NAD-dependent epimerase/dehydratase family protein, partial [Solirubrobacteraceae bacterium]